VSVPVGLVVVSHSRALATAAVALAREMAPADLPIVVAAGIDGPDGPTFGTDAVAIAAAVAEADRGVGVVVLMDLGSAVLSAELALDLLEDPDQRGRVLLCPAPLVEGLVVAAVAAGGGAGRAEIAAEAGDALAGKLTQLGGAAPARPPAAAEPVAAEPVAAAGAPADAGPVTQNGPLLRAPGGGAEAVGGALHHQHGGGGADADPGSDIEAEAASEAAAEGRREHVRRAAGSFVVANPHGLHARPVARLVAMVRGLEGADVRLRNRSTGSEWVSAASPARVAVVGAQAGHEVEIEATGPGARAAVDAILELAGRRFDEPAATGVPSTAAGSPPPGDTSAGVAAGLLSAAVPGSPGIAIGPARPLRPAAAPAADVPAEAPPVERAKLDRALDTARAEIEATRAAAARRLGADEAAIFDAHLALLDDPELAGAARAAIDSGTSAVAAWSAAVDRGASALEALPDPYLAARGADVRAVGDQVRAALHPAAERPESHHRDATRPDGGFPDIGEGVVVATELTPAQAVGLAGVAGVVLAGGSPTAHATLLLRAQGIPAVLGAGPGVLDVATGTTLALDGGTGELVVDPAPDVLAAFRERAATGAERDRAARERAGEPAVTRDGVSVLVGANIGSPADAAAAVGADLAGLVRTEFLFLGRDTAPDVDEQVAAYRAIAAGLRGRRITLRTLDVGGDKPLPYLPLPVEANPFLGLRGIRLADVHPELFRDQLLAVVRVARETPVSLMFPMVATVDELLAARRELDAVLAAEGAGTPAGLQVGIMVEVPAAAVKAAAFVPHVDFLSIGTNDLTQYALAAERGNPAVARLADPLDPGVLGLVAAVCRAAEGRALVAVCGEAAADPLAAELLVGLGVRELSVVPPAVAPTKQTVRDLDAAAAATRAAEALTADGPAAVRRG
jgi:phosphoenolpyruvate-protein phosphotransferase/dihydroxyacetone kinase phosphotransfer subunit